MAKPKLQDIFVSVVVVADKHSKALSKEVAELGHLLKGLYTNYEVIIIDNQIMPKELVAVNGLLDTEPCIRVIRLSKLASKDVCVFVGLESAIGDVLVVRSQHDPIKLLPKFIERARKADLVFGVSKTRIRKGVINNYGAKVFYWYNKRFLDISIPENSTYFMALSRRAINALTRSGRHARHIRYLARQIGYTSAEVAYVPKKTHLEKKPLRALIISALELATNYSKHPLRFLAWAGFFGALANLVYAGYVIAVRLFKGHVAEGWTTLSLQAALMFFLLFAILAILCEYVGKILEETRAESPYHIADEQVSKVSIADATRRNIKY